MSWFLLGNIEEKERKKIKGIWLRVESGNNNDVKKAIKNSKNLRFSEVIERVVIVELRKDNQVLLEVWSKSVIDVIRKKQRYNVFHILITQNPLWVCEGDLGKGSEI